MPLTDRSSATDAARAKSEFVARITRELRSPLVGLANMGRALSGANLTRDERETTTLLRESAQGLLQVINNLHDLSQLEAGLMRIAVGPVDLRLATEDVLESFAPRADSKRLDLALHYDSNLPKRIITDSGRYRQLLSIFVDNAINFTARGQVTIHVSAEEITETGVLLSVEIRDTGMGIDSGKLPALFDLSSYSGGSNGEAQRGAGLGFVLAKHLLAAMNSDVFVESQAGVGTSIRLQMKMPRDPNEWPHPAPLAALRGKRILIADSSSAIRGGLIDILTSYGIESVEAPDGQTALDLLNSEAAEGRALWAVLFSTELSGLDWQEFGTAVRQTEAVELVLLTRFANEPDASELEQAGFSYALRRNPTSSQLRSILQHLLNQRGSQSPHYSLTASAHDSQASVSVNTDAANNVLLVTPSGTELDSLTAELDSIGCVYSVAHDLETAFSRGYETSFDLILLDQALCRGQKAQTIGRIKDRKREGIIVLVDKLDDSAAQSGSDLGVDGILVKPVAAGVLQVLLERVSRERDGTRFTFDRKAALARCGNDIGLLAEVIGDFRASTNILMKELVNAIGAQDTALVLSRTRELEAAAQLISAERLCKCLEEISELVALQDWAALPGCLATSKIVLRKLISDLAVIGDGFVDAKTSPTLSEVDRGENILTVGDDYMSQRFIQRVLERSGYRVVSAATPGEAQNEVRKAGAAHYSCLIADFHSSAAIGMDLLSWMREKDRCISAVAISGSADKALVEHTLRAGVCNFLNKPLDRGTIERAVREAIELTHKARRASEMKRDVEQVGVIQRTLITASVGPESGGVTLCLHPKHEAGGDFLSHFQLAGSRSLVMLTDVSGHDLKSAFVSAYFHGMVRAMLEGGMSLGAVFDRCNQFLLNESNSEAGSIPISIAACSVIINEAAGEIEVLTSGSPSPILTTSSGECIRLRSGASFPLGWFADKQADLATLPLVEGQITLWTDGVEELADQMGVSPPAVAYLLIRAQQLAAEVPWLSKANDDILVATLRVQELRDRTVSIGATYWPILDERYRAEELQVIDDLQQYWRNSLSLAIPSLPNELLYDLLLCAREALINALKYGCAGGGEATLQLTFAPVGNTVTLLIEDQGPGHDFDAEEYHVSELDILTPFHRGLLLMKGLSSRFSSERKGARLIMDFTFDGEQL